MIYIVVFIIETILCALIGKLEKYKKLQIFLCIIVVLIISILGGARDTTIGTDVGVYGESFFNTALNYTKFSAYSNYVNSDIGYLMINYIVSRFSSDLNVFFFISQLIINTLFFSTMYKYRKDIPLWLSMLSYLTLYYCRTFDYLRQAFSLAIIFFSLRYIEQEKIMKYIVCILIASLFHASAIIAISFYFIYKILKDDKKRLIFMYITTSVTIVVVICLPFLMEILYNLDILSYRYYRYLSVFAKEYSGINIVDTFLRVILIILYLVQASKLNNKFKLNPLFGLLIIMDLIIFQIKNTIRMADRFAFYFGMMDILIIPQFNQIGKQKKDKVFINLILVAILFVFWFYKFVVMKYAGIYPYTSSILGI